MVPGVQGREIGEVSTGRDCQLRTPAVHRAAGRHGHSARAQGATLSQQYQPQEAGRGGRWRLWRLWRDPPRGRRIQQADGAARLDHPLGEQLGVSTQRVVLDALLEDNLAMHVVRADAHPVPLVLQQQYTVQATHVYVYVGVYVYVNVNVYVCHAHSMHTPYTPCTHIHMPHDMRMPAARVPAR